MSDAAGFLLTSPAGEQALAAAEAEKDPSSLAAGQRLREKFGIELATQALNQVALRRKAQAKFGSVASELFFTATGLEQATRWQVATWRAAKLRELGFSKVFDLGCGIAADAVAFARAGIAVHAIELDPLTAQIAAANLAPYAAKVQVGDLTELAPKLLAEADEKTVVFLDPARRTGAGRSWRVADFSPTWDYVANLLTGPHSVVVKAAPGLPLELIPDQVSAQWISHRSELVETCLWHLVSRPQQAARSALALPSEAQLIEHLATPKLSPGPIGRYLIEPDPAVLRTGLAKELAPDLHLVADQIGYLTSDEELISPQASCFEILASFDYSLKALKRWAADAKIGSLEIKKRGVDVDPSQLRKALKLKGTNAATIIITPTQAGTKVFVVRRLASS